MLAPSELWPLMCSVLPESTLLGAVAIPISPSAFNCMSALVPTVEPLPIIKSSAESSRAI